MFLQTITEVVVDHTETATGIRCPLFLRFRGWMQLVYVVLYSYLVVVGSNSVNIDEPSQPDGAFLGVEESSHQVLSGKLSIRVFSSEFTTVRS